MANLRTVVNAAIIEAGHLLMFKKNGIWTFPGGKLENGETDEECLRREYAEEVSRAQLAKYLQFYRTFQGVSSTSRTDIVARVYFARRAHSTPIIPSAEIEEVEKMQYGDILQYNVSDISKGIIERLHVDGFL